MTLNKNSNYSDHVSEEDEELSALADLGHHLVSLIGALVSR